MTHANCMEVAIIFDPAFEGETGPGVWIIDTLGNREWFKGRRELDPNSAVFSARYDFTVDEDVIQVISNAQEHHPSWDRISVIGAPLSQAILAALQDEGQISKTPPGFVLVRTSIIGRP